MDAKREALLVLALVGAALHAPSNAPMGVSPTSDSALSRDLPAREARIRGLYASAEAALQSGRREEALSILESILRTDPQHPSAYLGLVIGAQRRGLLAGGNDPFAGLSVPPGPGTLYGRGIQQFLKGRAAEAEVLLSRALEGYRTAGHAAGEAASRTALGNVRLRAARYEQAVADYEAARSLLEGLGDRRGLADVLGNLAAVRAAQGDTAAALQEYRRVLAIREVLDDRPGLAATHHNIGQMLRRGGDTDGAVRSLERALALHRGIGDRPGEAGDLNLIGLIRMDRGETEAARASLETSLALARALGDKRTEANALTNLGSTAWREGRTDEARLCHDQALAIRRSLGDLPGASASLNNLAVVCEARGDRGGALRLYEEALAIQRRLEDRGAEAAVLVNVGRLRVETGNEPGGFEALRRAVAIAEAAGDAQRLAVALVELGRVKTRHGDPAAARRAIERGLAVARAAADRGLEAEGLDALGVQAGLLGAHVEAAERLGEALRLVTGLEDRAREAMIRDHLGNNHFERGELVEALWEQTRVLEIRRAMRDLPGEATALGNLGAVYWAAGDRDRAARHIREAAERLRTLGHSTGEALARANLGVVLEGKGEPAGALREYRAAMNLYEAAGDRRGLALTRCSAASTLVQFGRTDESRTELEKALSTLRSLGDRGGEARALILFGDLERRLGRVTRASARYAVALRLARDSGMRDEVWRAEAGMAACHEAVGRWGEAFAALDRAMAGVESLRTGMLTDELRSRFLEEKVGLYEAAIRILWRQGGASQTLDAAARAFAYAERSKARGLLDLLAESRADLRVGVAPTLSRRETGALARIDRASRGLRSARNASERRTRLRALEDAEEALDLNRIEIRAADPRYAEIVYPVPATIGQVRAGSLRPGEVLLQYLLGEEASYLWVVSREEVSWHRLPPRSDIEAAARDLLETLRFEAADLGPEPAWRAAAKELGRMLLPPAATPPGGRLVIVPDGILHDLPFEALIPPRGDAKGPPRPLLESHELTYVPSASAWRFLRQTRRGAPRGPGRILVVADPAIPREVGGSEEVAPLQFARQEAERVSRLFRPENCLVWMGADATEAALKRTDLGGFRYVHVVAHGLIDEEAPQRSALLLAPGDPAEDGRLQLNEIFGLRLQADMVVLSACGTGLGRLVRGEGIVGMTRAFLYAGARSVLVSLWNVNDRSTADLMERFYRGLAAGRPPRAALREAKLALLRSERAADRHPSRWAPFILTGDPEPQLTARTADGATDRLQDEMNRRVPAATEEMR